MAFRFAMHSFCCGKEGQFRATLHRVSRGITGENKGNRKKKPTSLSHSYNRYNLMLWMSERKCIWFTHNTTYIICLQNILRPHRLSGPVHSISPKWKANTRRKTSRSKDEKQQQPKPTHMYGVACNTLVGCKCSHYTATPSPPGAVLIQLYTKYVVRKKI